MPYHIYDGASWRQMSKGYTYDGSAWKPIQQLWVWDGSTWKRGFIRTPGTVATVNYSIASTVNSGTTVTGTVTWSAPTGEDTGLNAVARFYSRYSTLASTTLVSEQVITSGTTASFAFPISSNQTLYSQAAVAVLNGTNALLDAVGAPVFSPAELTTTYQAVGSPTMSNPTLTFNFSTNSISVSWTFTNAPSGATFLVEWLDDYQNPSYQARPSTTTSPVSISSLVHGYNLDSAQLGGYVLTTFTVRLTMRDSGGTIVLETFGSNSCYALFL